MTSAPLAPGYRIGDYEILYELGRGAVGETFAARALAGSQSGRVVCLKVLAQEFRGIQSAKREVAIRYLQHEARVVSQLEHPNIAKLLDSGTAGDIWYLVFELVDGANLTDVLVQGMLGAYHVMHLGLELSKALACAHERDVLHRDIKPSNILISSSGQVKLVDFGLAKLNAAAASKFSQHVGTPRYFAPEQLRGEALTPATDIYSAGLVLFELLTRSHPFDSPDVDVFRENVLRGLPQRSLRGGNFPAELVAVVETCIQLDSAKRFANGTALANALRAAIDQCSTAGDADLGDLSLHGMADFGPHRAETILGDIADRVADIRDEPGDFPTRITTDPAEPYRRFAGENAPAQAAPQDAATAKFESQSIMGDLSRIARAVTEQRSSAIEPALPHRSGLRASNDGTPLRSQRRDRAAGDGDHSRASSDDNGDADAAPAAQRDSRQAPGSSVRFPRWAVAALICLLATAAVSVALLRPSSPSSVPAASPTPSASQPARLTGSSATPAAATIAPTHEAISAQPIMRQGDKAAAPIIEQGAENGPRSSDANAAPPSKASPKPKRADRSYVRADELISVTIGTIPYGEVTVDGRRVGPAPVIVKLSLGPHRVIGRSQELHRVETIVVNSETNHIVLDLRNDKDSP